VAEARVTVSGGPRLAREFPPDPLGAGPATTLRYRQPTPQRQPAFRVRLNTGRILDAVERRAGTAIAATLQAGKTYWDDVEWTKDRHPEMTGAMRDGARFRVEHTRSGVVAQVWVPPGEAPYADFEERGTIHRPGHYPIRSTVRVMALKLNQELIRNFPKGRKR
jgi:hypothetical protein